MSRSSPRKPPHVLVHSPLSPHSDSCSSLNIIDPETSSLQSPPKPPSHKPHSSKHEHRLPALPPALQTISVPLGGPGDSSMAASASESRNVPGDPRFRRFKLSPPHPTGESITSQPGVDTAPVKETGGSSVTSLGALQNPGGDRRVFKRHGMTLISGMQKEEESLEPPEHGGDESQTGDNHNGTNVFSERAPQEERQVPFVRSQHYKKIQKVPPGYIIDDAAASFSLSLLSCPGANEFLPFSLNKHQWARNGAPRKRERRANYTGTHRSRANCPLHQGTNEGDLAVADLTNLQGSLSNETCSLTEARTTGTFAAPADSATSKGFTTHDETMMEIYREMGKLDGSSSSAYHAKEGNEENTHLLSSVVRIGGQQIKSFESSEDTTHERNVNETEYSTRTMAPMGVPRTVQQLMSTRTGESNDGEGGGSDRESEQSCCSCCSCFALDGACAPSDETSLISGGKTVAINNFFDEFAACNDIDDIPMVSMRSFRRTLGR